MATAPEMTDRMSSMRRGRCGPLVLAVGIVLAACQSGSVSTPPDSSAATDLPSPPTVVTQAPSDTAVPSSPPATIEDLLADPLPTVTLEELGELEPSDWALLLAMPTLEATGEYRSETYPDPGSLIVQATLCDRTNESLDAEIAAQIEATHCLLLVALSWNEYARRPTPDLFDAVRARYAFAAERLGPDRRRDMDVVLRATALDVGEELPPTAPDEDLWASLLDEPIEDVDLATSAAVVAEAVERAPWAFDGASMAMYVGVRGSAGTSFPSAYEVASPIATCGYGHPGAFDVNELSGEVYDLSKQEACALVIDAMLAAAARAEEPALYDAAVFAFRLGVQGAPPCEDYGVVGSGCRVEWIDRLRFNAS